MSRLSLLADAEKDKFYKDMLPALVLPFIMSLHFYGLRAFLICAVSISGALISELIAGKIIKQAPSFSDCSSIYTGLLLALMMPASVRLWIPFLGSAFAVMFVKIPFGGADSSPFSCTAAALSFLIICKSKEIFAYPVLKNDATTAVFGSEDFVAGTSAAQSLLQNKTHGVTAVEIINTFIGSIPGPMGMTAAVVLLGLLFYVLIKRPKSFINTMSFLVTCFIGCVIITAIDCKSIFALNPLRMICVRFFSGFSLCIAIFLITEEAQSPKKNLHRIIYGSVAAVGYILLRCFSVFEDAGTFAVLAVNALWPVAEKYIFSPRKKAEVKSVE